ncbi:GH92 family glycosyl hydrolase [Marinoscillum pacificum]|uniref:GH92 family glycosyl hydrolase n=1 Tax=Marinoscillum pacificum TaxID=392723 RepID=UPI002157E28F|nr:GH92 family glycosyl hydrolase [Marinoscillum pacificum]
MKIIKYILGLASCVVLAVACQQKEAETKPEKYTQYVNTFVGTAPLTDPGFIGYTPPKDWRVWAGLTYPGASLPNAMVQLSPITAYHTGAGYQYEDSIIYGFTHTNKGHWNLCNIPVLPVVGAVNGDRGYQSEFSHDEETASPGFYSVKLQDFDINVKLTTTLRCGFHQYEYASSNGKKVLFDLSRANNHVREWDITRVDDHSVQGYQNMGGETIYFFAKLSEPIADMEVVKPEGNRGGNALITLKDGKKIVEMQIGLSWVSTDNAKANLDFEIGSKTFDQVREDADQQWETLLSKVKVEGGSERNREMFYSSLYRSFLWPALRSDVNGDFKDTKGEVQNKGFRYYTIPSLWDTYRNKLVLLSMISPDVSNDVIRTLQDIGENRGFIPTFFHGDHAAAYVSGAYLRGVRDYDVQKVYQLLLNNATKEGGTRPHIAEYIEKGYISTPVVETPHVESKAKAGVSKTLEYSYDDYSLALLAKELGDQPTYELMSERSLNFKNLFDSSTNFMRGRLEDGSWVPNFDPQYPYYEYMYREANAWQVSFFAPHAMPELVALYGGADSFEAKLDSLFSVPWNPNHIARNVSSFIGQYCHGNQPDHETPWAYYFVNKPEKSQKVLDNILNNFYGVGEHGIALSGMDDAGEMSSWYVFAAAGFYPLSAGDEEYIVSVPLFDKVSWTTPVGKEVVISKQGSGRALQDIQVDGKTLEGYFITHDLFSSGGKLDIKTK